MMSSGERMYPASVLVTNFPHATDTRPSLLLPEQAGRLFHELGHAMRSLLSDTRCARFHGPSRADRDFAEAVSMMFESFLRTPEYLANVSLHYSHLSLEYQEAWMKENPGSPLPPRQLPKDVIESGL